MHLLHDAGAQKLLVVKLSLSDLQPQPLGHVQHVGIDGAGRADVVDVAPGDRLHLLLDFLMRRRHVLDHIQGNGAGDAGVHAEGCEDLLLDKIIPASLGHGGNDLSGCQVHDILIAELAAEA